MFYKEPRVTLAFEDRMPESIPEEDIELLFPDGREDGKKCKVRIAPCVLLPEYENGKPIGKMFPEYPFFITATLGPDGSLQLPENPMDRVPMFVRKFLSPNAKDDRTLASLDEVDSLLSAFKTDVATEEEYWKACEALFRKATGMTFAEMNYPDQPEMVITKAPVTGMAQNILRLYDKLLDCKEDLPLLECLTRCECEPSLPLPARREIYANKRHLAQMSSDFPLSVSQRETLAMYTHPRGSRIFAVNGPPGTGKTTFLQTVIANRLVHSVLTDREPELIVASSVNNQAITNILKDFEMEVAETDAAEVGLAARWLPELDTLGLYLSGKEELTERYAMMLNTRGKGFPETYDNPERVDEYRTYYLELFNRYFHTSCKDETECQHYLRGQMALLRDWIETGLEAAAQKESGGVNGGKNLLVRMMQHFRKTSSAYEETMARWEENDDFRARYTRLTEGEEYRNLPCMEDMAVRLDISYRYQMFWYAIHYREAEFIRRLSRCSGNLNRSDRAVYLERLRRLACVMPVFISTFHSLPRYMTCSSEGNPSVPLYNTIDLLIVDESGQVSPELAVPSFSLARQAILVGDIEQIEPIWPVTGQYSFINLRRSGVVTPFKAQERLLRKLLSGLPDAADFVTMTVGTVHSLQGAQYPLVIFSPVNSPDDTSYFMEAGGKYNMLNVAVSRAQYHFLVFGHMNIFHPDRDTPSGNLAKWLFDSQQSEISSHFLYQDEDPLMSQSLDVPRQSAAACRLSTLEAHTDILRQALQTARRKVVIVSPFLSIRALESDHLLPLIQEAVERGVEVVVYTDHYLDKKNGLWKEESLQARRALVEHHVSLRVLKGIHNKTLVVDDRLLVEGSFNWLSARRNKDDARHECSILVQAPAAAACIDQLMQELETIDREALFYCPPKQKILCADFFCQPLYHNYWNSVLTHLRERASRLNLPEDSNPEPLQEIRKKYPRHRAAWTDEEVQLVWELMNYTNDLRVFTDCLQRSERSIRYKVEGTAP